MPNGDAAEPIADKSCCVDGIITLLRCFSYEGTSKNIPRRTIQCRTHEDVSSLLAIQNQFPLMQINDLDVVMIIFDFGNAEQQCGVRAMAIRETVIPTPTAADAAPLFNWGQERTEAAMALQKAILESYEQASRAWLDRVQSEVSLWSDLASKLGASHSIPEALESYATCVSQRMQMAADDGRRMAEESQHITEKLMKSLGNGRPAAST